MLKIFLFVLLLLLTACTTSEKTEESFCGQSSFGGCTKNSDCKTSGCSGQICQSTEEEEALTTCEFKDCYSAEKYALSCMCKEQSCQWVSESI